MIIAKIDLNKLVEKYYFPGKPKNGHEPLYVDLVLFENREGRNQFGDDFFIVQGIPKAAKAAGEKGPIVGNAHHHEARGQNAGSQSQGQRPPPPQQPPRGAGAPPKPDDDCPF